MPEETMMQETNAEEGFGFTDGLFDGEDYGEETNADEPQDTAEEETGEETEAPAEDTDKAENAEKTEEQPEEQPKEGLEITFLGEKKFLSHEEAKDLAEKGLRLDDITQQLQISRNNVAKLEAELKIPRTERAFLPLITAYAQTQGTDLAGFTAQMNDAINQAGLKLSPVAESNYLREKAVKDWQDFMTAYPGIDPRNDLPQEVWNAINGGLSPRAAMIEYKQRDFEAKMAEKDNVIAERDNRIAELEREIRTMKLNNENKKRAAGSLTSTAPAEDKTGFLGGLYG